MNFSEFLRNSILSDPLKEHRISVAFDPEGRNDSICNDLANKNCKVNLHDPSRGPLTRQSPRKFASRATIAATGGQCLQQTARFFGELANFQEELLRIAGHWKPKPDAKETATKLIANV